MLKKIEKLFDFLGDIVGKLCAFVMLVLIANVFYNVVARYFLKISSVGLQELQWHLFSLIILYGISYTLRMDAHVRVDIFYAKLEPKTQALINALGAIFFILPISILIATGSFEFVKEAYITQEASGDPGGLEYRWIIKLMIPIAFWFLALMSLGYFVKNLNFYFSKRKKIKPKKITGGL